MQIEHFPPGLHRLHFVLLEDAENAFQEAPHSQVKTCFARTCLQSSTTPTTQPRAIPSREKNNEGRWVTAPHEHGAAANSSGKTSLLFIRWSYPGKQECQQSTNNIGLKLLRQETHLPERDILSEITSALSTEQIGEHPRWQQPDPLTQWFSRGH